MPFHDIVFQTPSVDKVSCALLPQPSYHEGIEEGFQLNSVNITISASMLSL